PAGEPAERRGAPDAAEQEIEKQTVDEEGLVPEEGEGAEAGKGRGRGGPDEGGGEHEGGPPDGGGTGREGPRGDAALERAGEDGAGRDETRPPRERAAMTRRRIAAPERSAGHGAREHEGAVWEDRERRSGALVHVGCHGERQPRAQARRPDPRP